MGTVKTIFITSFHSLIGRNILHTPVLGELAREHRVVLLVPDFKKKYFEREFGSESIIIEGISTAPSRSEDFWGKIALLLLPSRTLAIKRHADFIHGENALYALVTIIAGFILAALGKIPYVISLFRWLDYRCAVDTVSRLLIERYRPVLIFATDITNPLDVRLLAAAKRAGVQTIAMVRSWDNVTAKGVFRIIPDHVVVHNSTLADEARRYNHVSPERISVVGVPHYDAYTAGISQESKEAFFKARGFVEGKPLVLFGPIGDRYVTGTNTTDRAALEALSELDVNILVRMPPADTADIAGYVSRGAIISVQQTGTRSWKDRFGLDSSKVNEISREDDETLKLSLTYTDVVVTGPSTLCIDAAVFDRPIVFVNFDGIPRSYHTSVKRYYDYEHFDAIKKSGGVVFANSRLELLECVSEELKRPALRREGRKRLIEGQCFRLDGQASQRLITVLRNALHGTATT